MRYLSVCSGIEAATAAWHPLGWEPVAFSEIEPFPSAVLAHHYPHVPNLGDMTKFKEWPEYAIDVLVGGTPCQSFSVAGLRKGLDDPRGNLMLTYLAIADKYRPRWLVWENVPGVLSSNGGKDFGTLLGGLGELGYGFAYRVLDAQYFGVAQRRRRVFVIGCLGDWRAAAAVLFERDSLQGNPAPSRKAGKSVAPTLSARTKGGGGLGTDFDCDDGLIEYGFASDDVCGIAKPLGAHALSKGRGTDLGNTTYIAHAIQAGATRENPNSGPDGVGVQANLAYTLEARAEVQMVAHSLCGEGFDASEDGTGRRTPLVPVAYLGGIDNENNGFSMDGPCGPLMKDSPSGGGRPLPAVAFAQNSRDEVREMPYVGALAAEAGMKQTSYIRQAMQARRLIPVECERLQGFKDNYTNVPHRGKPAADGPRYKALGNSMAVPNMRWLGQRIDQVDRLLKSLKEAA